MIQIAKQKSKNIQNISYEVKNILDIDYKNEYEVIISMFAAIPYIHQRRDVFALFEKVRNSLKNGGIFVFDLWNGIAVPYEFSSCKVKEVVIGNKKIIRVSNIEINAIEQVCKNTFKIMVIENNKILDEFEETHLTRFHTIKEVKDLLFEAGFKRIKCFPFGRMKQKITLKDWDVQFVAIK